MATEPATIGISAAPLPSIREAAEDAAAAAEGPPALELPVLLRRQAMQAGPGKGKKPLAPTEQGDAEAPDGLGEVTKPSVSTASAPAPPAYMYFIASCAALNSVNLGYDIGVSSGVGVYIRDELGLSEVQLGAFFGVLHFVAACGGLGSQGLADRLGRRLTFAVAQAVNLLGLALVSLASSFPTLMAGRVIVGLGVGIGLSVDPLYIAEAAPAAHRGKLTTWSELAINFGIMLGFVANWALAGLPPGINWRVMVGCGTVLPCVLVVLSLTAMPESPRWLVARGRQQEAASVVRRTHAEGEDVDAVLAEMQRAVQEDEALGRVGWRALLQPDDGTRRAVLVGLGIAVAQQLNGSESVIFYSPTIFERARVATTKQSLFAVTILVGLVKSFFVAVAASFLDSAGRRPLLVASTGCMAVSLVLLSLGSGLGIAWMAVAGALSFVAAFSLGIGPVCWLLVAELFPSRVRAKAMSVGVFLNRVTSATVALTFLPLSTALGGQAGYFGFFAAVTAGTALAAYLLVPETKCLSLEQLAARNLAG